MGKWARFLAIVLAIVFVIGFLIPGAITSITAVAPNNALTLVRLPATLVRLPATLIIVTPIRLATIPIITRVARPTAVPTIQPTFTATSLKPTSTLKATAKPDFTPTVVVRVPARTNAPQTCLQDKTLAYVRDSRTLDRTDIVLRVLKSGSETIPTANMSGMFQHPRWSDDGCILYVAYRKPGDGEKYHIWMLKGGQFTQLTTSPTDDELDPDSARGSKVVFAGEKGHLVVLDSLLPQNQTDLGVEGTQPSVSPDGSWVLYVNAQGELSVISIQGGKAISLGYHAQNPRWAPSGKGGYFAAVQQDGSLALGAFTFYGNPPDLKIDPLDSDALDIAVDPEETGQAVLVAGPLGREQLELVPSVSPVGKKTQITMPSADPNDLTTNSAPDIFSPVRTKPDMLAANAYFASLAQKAGTQ